MAGAGAHGFTNPASITFTITATGPGGTATDSVTVTWQAP